MIVSTFPDEELIVRITKDFIVTKKLCACISVTKVRSIYEWDNKLEDQQEFFVFFKTTKLRANRLKEEIRKVHPYKVPEILEIKLHDVSKPYLAWLVQSTSRTKKPHK